MPVEHGATNSHGQGTAWHGGCTSRGFLLGVKPDVSHALDTRKYLIGDICLQNNLSSAGCEGSVSSYSLLAVTHANITTTLHSHIKMLDHRGQ
ncbi:uncharacterized protein ARMOST_16113 [Armillaria ostoyae]|uniref:Uncharacterized protein n=1 Tax=Armillaria ostoyae TaxID=47428 RepID=A0A284RVA7_ARMOS|nr:uncharacterized protein ARMOST_16113 [Armillaria ostoyae]